MVKLKHIEDNDEGKSKPQLIAQLKQIRQELEYLRKIPADHRYRDQVDGLIQGYFIHDNFRPLLANRAMIEMFGYDSVEELLGLDSALMLVAPEHHPKSEQANAERRAGKNVPDRTEYMGVRKDGSTFWFDSLERLVKWEGRMAVQMVMVDINDRKQADLDLEERIAERTRDLQLEITERKQAEEALRANEARLQEFIDLSPNNLAYIDKNLYYRQVNKGYLKFMGMTEIEIIGRPVAEVIGKEPLAFYQPWIDKVLKGVEQHFQVSHPHGELGIRDMEIRQIPKFDSHDQVVGFYISTEDITERKLVERSLKESEARFKSIFKYSPTIIHLKDLEGRFLLVNDRYEEWTGIPMMDLIGKTAHEFHTKDLADRVLKQEQHVMTSGETVWEEVVIDGDVPKTYINFKFPVLDETEQIMGIGTIATDITEQKAAEEEILRLNSNLERTVEERTKELRDILAMNKQIISNAPIGMAIYAPTGQCITANDAIAAVVGATREDVLSQNYNTVESWKRSGLVDKAKEALNTNSIQRHDINVTTTFGRNAFLECHLVPLYSKDNPHLLLMINDISERKHAEAKMIRNEKMATLGKLIATVSHELRNPLGTMRTSMFVIGKKFSSEDPGLKKLVDRVDRNITRCDNIIDEMLDFTREQEFNLESVLLDDWLDTLLDEQSLPKGITLSRRFTVDGVSVELVPERFRRAVINVYQNACQAITDHESAGEGTEKSRISISTGIKDDRVLISISDTGPGIPSDVLPNIFEPMFSTKNFGVGLGLPIVKNIVEEHGGKIEVDSEEGQGTRVTLWLPLVSNSLPISS